MIDEKKLLDLMDKSPLFNGIPRKLLAPIFSQSMVILLEPGEQLLSPGVLNEHVYIIISGQLSVHLNLANLNEPLAVLNPGECVGEMSVLVDSVVSAFVIAKTECQLLAISYSSFWALIKGSNESARNMLNILVQRIRMGNEFIADTLLRHDKFADKRATIDSLTGLYNLNGIQEKFVHMLDLCTMGKQYLYLIILKVDVAKIPPATVPELCDEQILHTLAQTILTSLRPGDCAAHLNENKFAMLLTNTPLPDVFAIADNLREAISQTPIRLPDGSSLPAVTVSAGICKANESDTWGTSITKANQALERALNVGPNRISD